MPLWFPQSPDFSVSSKRGTQPESRSSRSVDYTGEFVLNQGVPTHSQTGMNEIGVNLNMTFSTADHGGHFQVSTVPTVFTFLVC